MVLTDLLIEYVRLTYDLKKIGLAQDDICRLRCKNDIETEFEYEAVLPALF